jgi:hypothetical protein
MDTKQKTVDLQIPLNQSTFTKEFTLDTGFIPRVVAYTNGIENATKEMLQLALLDSNGNEIIPAVNIENWKSKTGGNYMESMKQLGIEAKGRTFKLVFTTDRNLAAVPPVSILPKVQVVFLYSKTK